MQPFNWNSENDKVLPQTWNFIDEMVKFNAISKLMWYLHHFNASLLFAIHSIRE